MGIGIIGKQKSWARNTKLPIEFLPYSAVFCHHSALPFYHSAWQFKLKTILPPTLMVIQKWLRCWDMREERKKLMMQQHYTIVPYGSESSLCT
jgi:hypothetical protein